MAISVLTANSIIWIDHMEDGYDDDVTQNTRSPTTEVWGDGDLSNGVVRKVITGCSLA